MITRSMKNSETATISYTKTYQNSNSKNNSNTNNTNNSITIIVIMIIIIVIIIIIPMVLKCWFGIWWRIAMPHGQVGIFSLDWCPPLWHLINTNLNMSEMSNKKPLKNSVKEV